MKPTSRLFVRMLALSPLLLLASCGVHDTLTLFPTTTTNYTLSVSPQPTSIPVGSTVIFTATTNAPTSAMSWALAGFAYANLGSPNTASNTTTFTYTAPATPPVYTNFISTAGVVTINTYAGTNLVNTTFTITAPSITTGISAVNTSVALGATQVLYAYAVGSTNNAITLQVNGVTGGSASTGTIAAVGGIYGQYQYTAPTSIPMSGNPITLTVVSQADATKTSSLAITLH